MSIDEIHQGLRKYYSEKLETFGATPRGVDYNGPQAQEIRFAQLLKVIDPSAPFTVIDYGCGYGALFDLLQSKGRLFEYHGIDLIEKMVLAGRETHRAFPNAHFTTREDELPWADYLLAGSIFNNKLEVSNEAWMDMVQVTLRRMDALCTKGFAFNMLTAYSDADRMAQRPDLYFADPLFFFDFCKRNFSLNVALLHDYGIYDFTILVRKVL